MNNIYIYILFFKLRNMQCVVPTAPNIWTPVDTHMTYMTPIYKYNGGY